jgi:hypothetical protein
MFEIDLDERRAGLERLAADPSRRRCRCSPACARSCSSAARGRRSSPEPASRAQQLDEVGAVREALERVARDLRGARRHLARLDALIRDRDVIPVLG